MGSMHLQSRNLGPKVRRKANLAGHGTYEKGPLEPSTGNPKSVVVRTLKGTLKGTHMGSFLN